jgi:hypothetical protein
VLGSRAARERKEADVRKLFVTLLATTLVAGAAWTVLARRGTGTTPVRCIDTLWRHQKVSTTSTTFANVPGFTDAPSAIFPITIQVSAVVKGAPVMFRVLSTNVGEQTHASKPGITRFVPAGRASSFSFQWVEPNQSAAVHANTLRLQWRSPSGQPVNLLRGDMSVAYDTDGCRGAS